MSPNKGDCEPEKALGGSISTASGNRRASQSQPADPFNSTNDTKRTNAWQDNEPTSLFSSLHSGQTWEHTRSKAPNRTRGTQNARIAAHEVIVLDDSDSEGEVTRGGWQTLTTEEKGQKIEDLICVCPWVKKYVAEKELQRFNWNVNDATSYFMDLQPAEIDNQLRASATTPEKDITENGISFSSPTGSPHSTLTSPESSNDDLSLATRPLKPVNGVFPRIQINTKSNSASHATGKHLPKPKVMEANSKSENVDDEDVKMEDGEAAMSEGQRDSVSEAEVCESSPTKSNSQGKAVVVGDDDGSNIEVQTSEKDTRTIEQKEAHLRELYPQAAPNDVHNALAIEDGDMDAAAAALDFDLNLMEGEGVGGGAKSVDSDEDMDTHEKRLEHARSHKRKAAADPEADRKGKKRQVSSRTGSNIEPASEWVENYFTTDRGYRVALESGIIHPNMFPRALLQNFKRITAQDFKEAEEKGAPIRFHGVSLVIFNLALQWAMCRNIGLSRAQTRTEITTITVLLNLLVACDLYELDLGLQDSESKIMGMLRGAMVRDRNAIQPEHAAIIYKFHSGHPIRQLFLDSVFREFVEFRYKSPSDEEGTDEDESETEHLDAARKAAYQKTRWRFQPFFNSNEYFKEELEEKFRKAWWRRKVVTKKRGKTFDSDTTLLDPLTSKRFVI